jgi:hypothetical protein
MVVRLLSLNIAKILLPCRFDNQSITEYVAKILLPCRFDNQSITEYSKNIAPLSF